MQENKQYNLPANSREPKYVQVEEVLKLNILSGEWAEGEKIPTESELCEMFDVSRITVRKALEELQGEGYLQRQQGKGTFVAKGQMEQRLSKFYSFSDELKKRGMTEYAAVIKLTVVEADDHVASRLQIEPGDPVWRVYRQRCTNDGPYAVETSYIPVAMIPEMTKEQINENGLYRTMASLGIKVDSANENFKAVNVTKEQARLLAVREDVAAIRLRRIAYSAMRPVEYCTCIVRGDFFSYSVERK